MYFCNTNFTGLRLATIAVVLSRFANEMPAGRGALLTLATLRQQFAAVLEKNGFESTVFRSLKILEAKDGKCQCSMRIEQQHTNRSGFLHGGVTASLIDTTTTMSIQTLPPFLPGVSTDLSLSFIKPAAVGEKLLVTAQVLKQGRSMSFATGSVEIISSDGQLTLIAFGKHTKFIQQKSSDASANLENTESK